MLSAWSIFSSIDHRNYQSMDAKELCSAFDVSQSAVARRSMLIRNMFQMYQLDPNWTLPSKLDDNPFVWMITVNGFTMDARNAPAEIQYEAYRA
jgi:hypothetical protein